ncbi:MAG TPA: prolyl oligopeptidase family serine peptidase [Terriglobales bacterium]|nr:prolyl oligopeptidase family serine peptidase [Terriglobales bacterium]
MRKTFCAVIFFLSVVLDLASAQTNPKLTLDEFFNSVGFASIAVSPDGQSVVVGTERADWDQQIFRKDLWLYRDANGGSLVRLTESGHDTAPQWSPDGHWIAFLSDRKTSDQSSDADDDSDPSDTGNASKEGTDQLYLISPTGGEAFAITQGQEEVHSFAWSPDSKTIYFATRNPWTKQQKDDYRKQWKDTTQYRTAERGDTIFALELASAVADHEAAVGKVKTKEEKQSDLTPGARTVSTSQFRVDELVASPDGNKLGFLSSSINKRQEKYDDFEIYTVDLSDVARAPSPANSITPHRVTQNQAQETHIHWANDNRHVLFTVEVGDVAGPYRDLQPHLYSVDSQSGSVEQWNKGFNGSVEHYAVSDNEVLTSARLGTEVQIYSGNDPRGAHLLTDWPGTFEEVSAALHGHSIAFVYSSLTKPTEVYLASSESDLKNARPITAFNKLFAGRDLPQGKPYQWKADDGTTVEGMLVYPPGKFGDKHLPMFTFIHGGPADADGNHFGADWYQWGALAATQGWLVFEPNYRGSSGYGDKFLQQIVPQIVSRPGKDILEGVDALVKDGIADRDRLSIGGYSYGGYMTNWLITQSTQWKAAVTGAGAVEHVGNWGNDDTTFDDAYFLGGRPWEAPQRYHDEAAIFQINKVRTPTHIVAGADDIRVAVLEDYLLEHALYALGIPNALLIFPGEGHSLDKNPWHGKIKVREELNWLHKYGQVQAQE